MVKFTKDSSFVILGAGAWGTALALHLARLGQPIKLWSFETDHILEMQKEKCNRRYLPQYPFPDTLIPITDLKEALKDATDILIAVPSQGFKDTLLKLKELITPKTRIVWATKGLDEESGKLLHTIIEETLGTSHPLAILSGPSFASEVAASLPTAIVIASNHSSFAEDLKARFNGDFFRIYLSDDIIGVEVGGAIKNVLAIATGISDGMGFGANARAALITRGLSEITRLGIALGGQYETFTGLTGLGDLVLTCTDNQSRNRRFGLLLGQGMHPKEAEKEIKQVVEGKRNAELCLMLAQKVSVDMPISTAVFQVLKEEITAIDAMRQLLSRTSGWEV